ncbi:MAG: DUF6782 family putative metallopeptidase [Alphaproteobacteria bacterium]
MTENHDKSTPPPKAPQKPWLARVKLRVKKIVDTVDDRCAQLRHGSHASHKKNIIARLKELPGGEAMLLTAKQHDIKISVVSLRRNKGSKGKFTRVNGQARVRVSNTGSDARMATTLWHELRHMQQHIERGDLAGGTTRVKDTRAQHMISLMIEADAFTAQMLMGLREKKAGNPEYFNALMERESPAFDAIRSYLKKTPYESVADETAFARGLFTEMMLTGLPAYHAKFFTAYAKTFEKAGSVDEFRHQMATKKAPPDFSPSKALHDIYGEKPPQLRPLAAAFLCAQDKDVRRVIRLVDKTISNADVIDETEFQQAKAEIVSSSKRLAKAFRKNAVTGLPQKQDLLRKAALRL